jgi:beta-aspartyl-peptidase (threonine type)
MRQGKIACEMKLPPDRVEALRRARDGGKYPMARAVESAPMEGYALGLETPPMAADFVIWEIVDGSEGAVVYEWAGVVIAGQLWSRGQFEWRAQRLEQSWPEIRKVLDAQAAAWSKGDLEGYMDGYARSPDTLFLGGASITRGFDEVLERYKRKYTPQNMGKLAFTDLELTTLGSDGALVTGRWQLTREKDAPKGLFTVLLRKRPEGWRIVVDHSSTEP